MNASRLVLEHVKRLKLAVEELARIAEHRNQVVKVSRVSGEAVPTLVIIYLNRLSDMAFVLSRVLNRANGQPDVLWHKGRSAGASPESGAGAAPESGAGAVAVTE